MVPFFTYTSPVIARNALRFRYRILDSARQRAAELAQRGALYPWRRINGEEASAYYAAGTAQYHINAAVTYALRASFLLLPERITLPPAMRRALRYVPAAVLTAIWAPELVAPPRLHKSEVMPVALLLLVALWITVEAQAVLNYLARASSAIHRPALYIEHVLGQPPVPSPTHARPAP